MPRIYLDHHSKTSPDPTALEKAHFFLKEVWADSSSPHAMGQEGVEKAIESYQAIAEMLGLGDGDELFFVGSGPEAITQVLFSVYLDSVRQSGKNHILTTSAEEVPTILGLRRLEELGCAIKTLPLNNKGQLSLDALKEGIKPRTCLLSFAWANTLTGVVQPMEEIAAYANSQGIEVHVDASAVIGKLFFRFQDLPVDYLTIDGSLIHAPLGTSIIVCKKGKNLSPLLLGKNSLDKAGIISLKIALEKTLNAFDHMSTETARLRTRLEQLIQERIPDSLALFESVERLSNTTVIAFPGVVNDALLFCLDHQGLYATLGGGRMQKLSHMLLSLGIEPELAYTAISFVLSYDTTQEEIEKSAEILAEAFESLRKTSMGLV